ETKGLPSLGELEELWFALQTEMTESGKVSRFNTEVVSLDGGSKTESVVRVGTFNLVGEEGYLVYDAESKQVLPLGRQPDSYMTDTAIDFSEETSGIQPF